MVLYRKEINKRSSSEEKEEVSTSEPVEEKKEETEVETKKEEKKESTSFDENQQAAIDASLANAGLGQEDVTDIGCTLDEATQQYTVTFTFQISKILVWWMRLHLLYCHQYKHNI